jgi:O-methyltransferase involved in polyketide biosynthesis
MIHAHLEGVARTLVMTLRARSEEHLRDDSQYTDAWSHEWYQWMPNYPDYDAWYTPAFQLASTIRTAILDDITNTFIEKHDNPVIVEIGGGLSSRPYRVGIERAQWVILDLPAAMSIRYKVDAQNDNLLFLSQSATSDNWLARLPETKKKDYLFIAESVLMFIEEQEVMELIDRLRTNFSSGTFAFDILRGSYREREEENFAQMSADIKFHMDESAVKELGLKKQKIDYLLTTLPERWEELDIEKGLLTKGNSGFVVSGTLPKV